MTRTVLLVVCCCVAAAWGIGCKGKSATVEKDVPDARTGDVDKDTGGDTHIVPPDGGPDHWVPPDVDDFHIHKDVPDYIGPDQPDYVGPDQPDLKADVWAPEPCQGHEDCDGLGMCVELAPGSGKWVCAPYCAEECPADWTCKSMYVDGPDPVSLCFPPTETICSACTEHKECLFAGSLCIKGSGAVGYCGKLCDLEKPECPDGFTCAMAKAPNGDNLAPQCMPVEGSCCVAGKLKSCDDQNPCTADTCDPGMGCKHKNFDGPCTGTAPCTTYKCINGACMGIPITIDYTKDGIDDDCDGMTDEDWMLDMSVPFYTFGSGIGELKGGGVTIQGAVSTPPVAGVSSGGDFKVTPVTTKIVQPQE